MKERYFKRIQRDLKIFLRNKGPTTIADLEKHLGYGTGFLRIVVRKTPEVDFVIFKKKRFYCLKK